MTDPSNMTQAEFDAYRQGAYANHSPRRTDVEKRIHAEGVDWLQAKAEEMLRPLVNVVMRLDKLSEPAAVVAVSERLKRWSSARQDAIRRAEQGENVRALARELALGFGGIVRLAHDVERTAARGTERSALELLDAFQSDLK